MPLLDNPLLIGLWLGLLTLFLNYCLGRPGSGDFWPQEIFSFYPLQLARRKLKKLGLYPLYQQQYQEGMKQGKTKAEQRQFKQDFKKVIYQAAEPFFTWERAAGMCPVCNGVWLSIGGGLLFTTHPAILLIIVLVSHVVIRTLNKLI